MTDAKLYVDRARVATGLGSISSIDTLIFGREIDGVVDSRKYDGAFGALTYKASKGTERVQGGDLDSLESIDQLVFGVELDKIKNFTAGREKLFEDALGGTNRPIVSSVADQPVKPKLRDFGQHRPVRPDPFATHSERLKAALEEHPAHLIAERWSLQRVARAYAFRLEQIGSSLEGSTRNLARLCDALKVGTVVDNRLVALGATDTQRIAASWGMVIDRAQIRELFELRGLSVDASVPISHYVRRFSEPLAKEGSILDQSRPRVGHVRPPPMDFGGGEGPYSECKQNLVEQARANAYRSIGSSRRDDMQDAWKRHVDARTTNGATPNVSSVARLHTRMEESGTTHTDAIRKVLRTVGTSTGTATGRGSVFPATALRLDAHVLGRIAAGLGVALAPADVELLLGQYGNCNVSEFASKFLASNLKARIG